MRKNQKEKAHEADNEISETPGHFDENENITVKMKVSNEYMCPSKLMRCTPKPKVQNQYYSDFCLGH